MFKQLVKSAGLLVAGLALGLGAITIAGQSITIPNTFTNGTVADATQVNANFNALSANALNRAAGVFSGTPTPSSDNTIDLGSGALRFATIYGYAGNFKGNTTLGDAAADSVTINGTITSNVIATDATYDLGASGATRFRDFFLSRDATLGRDATVGRNLSVTAGNIIGRAEFNAGNSGAAITIDFTTNGALQKVTRTANSTYTLTAPPSPATVVLKLVHEASATVYTVTFSPAVKFPSGTAPTWTNTSGAIDIITLYWDGASWYGVQQAAFA